MKPESDYGELLKEVISDGGATDLRASSLDHALAAVRRQRRMRVVRGASLGAGCVVLVALLWREHADKPLAANNPQPLTAVQATVETVPGTKIRLVSDEELLAMFPDRPVALVGPPNDRRFVFLDEQRSSRKHGASGRGLNL